MPQPLLLSHAHTKEPMDTEHFFKQILEIAELLYRRMHLGLRLPSLDETAP